MRQLKLGTGSITGNRQPGLRIVQNEKEEPRIPSARFPRQQPLLDLKLMNFTISC